MIQNEQNGSVVFATYAAPSLRKGNYQIEVKQSSTIKNCQIADAGVKIVSACDSFTLPKDEVYSVYPPENAIGKFDLVIPHAVFKRRTLPWERNITGGTQSDRKQGLPWITLLIFNETEKAVIKEMTLKKAYTKIEGIYCPQPEAEEITEEDCYMLEVEAELFHEVCPRLEDLIFMAHAKGVSLEDKVTDEGVTDSWFSCLLANRYLQGATKDGVKYHAYVVSLEYYGEYLDKTPQERAAMAETTVRIPVLYSWGFHLLTEDFDFASVFKALKADCLISKASRELLEKKDSELLSMGYVLLNHELREGSKTVSWYRGPFTPCQTSEEERKPQCFADALLKYDPETGMFDTSYSAAWQLGRMLALKAKSFAGTMEKWRYQNKLAAANRHNSRLLMERTQENKETAVENMLEEFLHRQGLTEESEKGDG